LEAGVYGGSDRSSAGPVVEAFLESGFAVFSINPKQLDRFRDRYSGGGAKEDSRDAYVAADSLLKSGVASRLSFSGEISPLE
jgi:hypothetical protein